MCEYGCIGGCSYGCPNFDYSPDTLRDSVIKEINKEYKAIVAFVETLDRNSSIEDIMYELEKSTIEFNDFKEVNEGVMIEGYNSSYILHINPVRLREEIIVFQDNENCGNWTIEEILNDEVKW